MRLTWATPSCLPQIECRVRANRCRLLRDSSNKCLGHQLAKASTPLEIANAYTDDSDSHRNARQPVCGWAVRTRRDKGAVQERVRTFPDASCRRQLPHRKAAAARNFDWPRIARGAKSNPENSGRHFFSQVLL